MSAGRPDPAAVRQLMKLAGVSPGGRATDRELIERFVHDRSEGAFADLMARHGPMVLAVCKRHLRDPHAAEDAFQAVFIVLARRAGAVKWRASIGGWLFEVATRVAKKAAGQAARRAAREGGRADAAPEPEAPPAPAPADLTALQAALDEELRALPEKFRAPVVLCHLEGLSQEEVARHLGISDGQLRGRLYRAKERLRERLLRRGFTLTAVLLALTMGGKAQAVPAVLAAGTLRLASAAPDAIPTAVHLLAQGVIRDMGTSFKALAAMTVLSVIGVAAAGFAVRSALADAPHLARPDAAAAARPDAPPPGAPLPPLPKLPAQQVRADEKKPEEKVERMGCWIKGVEAAKLAVRVKLDDGGAESTIELGPQTKISFAGKSVKLDELQPGMRGELIYPMDQNAKALELRAAWPGQKVKFRAVDAAKGAVTFAVGGDGGVDFPVTLEVAKDARVVVDGLPAGLADLPTGREVELHLSLDKRAVVEARADGGPGDIPAVVRQYDPAAQTLLVEFEAEANDRSRKVTLCLPVNASARVRLAGSDAKPSDLQPRMPVRLVLTPDRKAIAGVLAGHPLPAPKDDDDDK